MIEGLASGLKVGVPTVATMFAVEKALPLDEGQISIAVAVSCTVFICGIVWFLSSRFTRIDDRLGSIEKRLAKLPCDSRKGKCHADSEL